MWDRVDKESIREQVRREREERERKFKARMLAAVELVQERQRRDWEIWQEGKRRDEEEKKRRRKMFAQDNFNPDDRDSKWVHDHMWSPRYGPHL